MIMIYFFFKQVSANFTFFVFLHNSRIQYEIIEFIFYFFLICSHKGKEKGEVDSN